MKSICLSLLVFTCSFSFAQKIHLGPEIGMNVIKVGSSEMGGNYSPSWHAGGTFEYDFFDWMSIKSGIYYTQKKQSYEEFDTIPFAIFGFDPADLGISGIDFNSYSETQGRYSQNYFEMPILANFKWEGINVGLGGYFGFMFSSRSRQIEATTSPFMQFLDIGSIDSSGFLSAFLPPAYEETFSESSSPTGLTSFDFGLKASLGYQYEQFGFHAAYQYGLTDHRTNATGDTQRHQYFQFSINYLFAIGRKDNQPRLH